MTRAVSRILPVLAAALFITGTALGEDIVKARIAGMKDISMQMMPVAKMIRGDEAFDADAIAALSAAVAAHARRIPGYFPEGSLEGEISALPKIWQDWRQFTAIANSLEIAADSLGEAATAASDANDIVPAFQSVAETCTTCHQRFRAKRE